MGLARDSNCSLHCQSNMLPEKIGEYKILASLGSGTFGDVYKVEKDDKLYALKHIVLGSKVDNVILQLEVDSHGSIPKHENIVGFVGYFKSWYRWNIVLEFCELGTLESYVLASKPEHDVVMSFMLDMASGLNHLHGNNIVHRDIKPENILLVKGSKGVPRCKISDFGVARFISENVGDSQITNGDTTGEKYFRTLRGTPFFVAPEVRSGHYTKSCDIFSLGIVFYLMFAREISSDKRLVPYIRGGTPFYKATEEQIKGQVDLHVQDEKINQLICSMMLIDLETRISASELEEELKDKCDHYRRVTRQNNVLNILSTVKEQLAKLEKEGFCSLLMWYDLNDTSEDSNPGHSDAGSNLATADLSNLLDRYTGLVDNKTDNEHLDYHTDEYSLCSMSTQSSPFEPEVYSEALTTPITTSTACQTDPVEPPLEPATAATSHPPNLALSWLSNITLTSPGCITISSPAGITLCSPAGINITSPAGTSTLSQSEVSLLSPTSINMAPPQPGTPDSHGTESVFDTGVPYTVGGPRPRTRSSVSSTSSGHSPDYTTGKQPSNIGRSASFASTRNTSKTSAKGSSLERSSSSASSRKISSPVVRARSSPLMPSLSPARAPTSPKPLRATSPKPLRANHQSPSKSTASHSSRKASFSESHTNSNHTSPSSPPPRARASSSRRTSFPESHTATSGSMRKTSHPSSTLSSSTTSPTQKKKKHPPPASSKKTSTSTKTVSHPPSKATSPSPSKKKTSQSSTETSTPKTTTASSPETTPTKKVNDDSKGSVFGRLFRWK